MKYLLILFVSILIILSKANQDSQDICNQYTTQDICLSDNNCQCGWIQELNQCVLRHSNICYQNDCTLNMDAQCTNNPTTILIILVGILVFICGVFTIIYAFVLLYFKCSRINILCNNIRYLSSHNLEEMIDIEKN